MQYNKLMATLIFFGAKPNIFGRNRSMNIVWSVILIAGLIILMIIDPNNAFARMLEGSEKAIELSIKLWAVYALWLGILQIIEDTKLSKVFQRILSPIIAFLFPNVDDYTKEQIVINLASNILGMGNACTPSGINAIGGLAGNRRRINSNMATLIIFNTANIQLIPTTIIGIRVLHQSAAASSIIVPTIITSCVSVVVGVVISKICGKLFDRGGD